VERFSSQAHLPGPVRVQVPPQPTLWVQAYSGWETPLFSSTGATALREIPAQRPGPAAHHCHLPSRCQCAGGEKDAEFHPL